ncbi:MAG: metalloregulator ArsR/SmtB family transcription factor, partial [Microbacterium sp.]
MSRAEPEDLATLADPTRARILRLIRDSDDGRMLVGRLAAELELRQPTVSHHMKALHADGLVVREPDGRRVWYSIAAVHADRIDALLGGRLRPDAAPDLDRIAADLSLRFRGVFSPETVRATVEQSHELLSQTGAAPLLSSRTATFAATRLEALSRSTGAPAATPTVLFVCVQNAGRSQLAAGILRQL